MQNAAYMRLKNLQLGYTLPATWTKKAGISKCRLFVSGENLLTFTSLFDVFDPETCTGGVRRKCLSVVKYMVIRIKFNFLNRLVI